MTPDDIRTSLLRDSPLLSRKQALERAAIPATAGVYGFFFSGLSRRVATAGSEVRDSRPLLYLGIAPSRAGSKSNLRKRLRGHLRGNASGSTLRLTLGSLLAADLEIALRPTGRTGRLTFGEGEAVLSDWLDEHARIAWVVVPEPWSAEAELIQRVSLPLNLEFNQGHPFHATLTAARSAERARGRSRARA